MLPKKLRTYNLQPKKGFTLIELLISVSVVLLLIAAMYTYGNLQLSSRLNATAAEVAQTLRIGRQRAVAGFNNAAHGVYFEANQYTLYQDSTSPFSYATRDTAYDQVIPLNSQLSFSPVPSDVLFAKGLGTISASVTITLAQTGGGTRLVSVNQFGAVKEGAAEDPTNFALRFFGNGIAAPGLDRVKTPMAYAHWTAPKDVGEPSIGYVEYDNLITSRSYIDPPVQ